MRVYAHTNRLGVRTHGFVDRVRDLGHSSMGRGCERALMWQRLQCPIEQGKKVESFLSTLEELQLSPLFIAASELSIATHTEPTNLP